MTRVERTPEAGVSVVPVASVSTMLSEDGSVTRLLRPYRFRLLALSAVSFAGGALEAVFLVLLTRTAFAISDGRDSFGVVGGLELSLGESVAVGVGLVLLRTSCAVAAATIGASLTVRVTADLRHEVGRAYLGSDWPTQHDDPTGQLQTLLTNFTGSGSQVATAATTMLTAGCNLAALLLLAVLVDPVSAVLVALAVTVLAIAIRPLRAAVRTQSRRAAKANLEYSSALSEISELGMEMHVFNVQEPTRSRVGALVDRQAGIDRRTRILSGLVPALYTGLAYLAMLLALGMVAMSHQADLRTAGAVVLVMLRSLSYGQALQTGFTTLAAQRPYLEQLGERYARYQHHQRVDHGAPVGKVGVLELRDVGFSYVVGQSVFTGVNLQLSPGEVVGIVGPSGGGKSTLVQLLLGLRRPERGAVMSDGRDVSSLAHHEWSRAVTFVPQQPRLVAGTVAENIRFFRDGVSQQDVEEAARHANLHLDVMAWPEGYDRQVGDHGSRLSGGQQQRVCIARALVENPDVMLLDEPTSALDHNSEIAVRNTLHELRGRVTVVIIAHRPATIEICDRVIRVEDGAVVETGTS